MAAACGIADSVLEHRDYKRQAPWLYGDNTSGDNPSINGVVTFAFALITYVALQLPILVHNNISSIASKILYPFLSISLSSLSGHAKPHLSTLTRRYTMKRRSSQR